MTEAQKVLSISIQDNHCVQNIVAISNLIFDLIVVCFCYVFYFVDADDINDIVMKIYYDSQMDSLYFLLHTKNSWSISAVLETSLMEELHVN